MHRSHRSPSCHAPRRIATLLAVAAAGAALLAGPAAAADSNTTTSNGVSRTMLGQTDPQNAPGQTLSLQVVRIAPGVKLAQHYHQGTQVARIVSGTLTYSLDTGSAAVTAKGATTETVTGPKTITLRAGDTIVENAGLPHHAANKGKVPVVIDITALLQTGAPLATPAGTGATGTSLRLTADLESQSKTTNSVGANGADVYGWNRLTGTATLNGQPVAVELLGNVDYTTGAGPFSGFVTFTFPDGSLLGVRMQGVATKSADGNTTTFAATLGVISGTGTYATATGTGTFTGSRDGTLGTAVSSTFDLTLGNG